MNIDMGRIVGIGTARGYDPVVLEMKTQIEIELHRAHGLVGMDLEHAALEELVKRHRSEPFHEASGRNALVSVGQALMLDLLIGAGGTVFNNANAALGVGDSSAAFNAAQTNLQGAVNVTDRVRKAMDATFPSRSGNVLSFRSTFATTDANFVWNEWAAFNNVTDGSGTMLNRSVANLGTKTSAAAWQLLATITQN